MIARQVLKEIRARLGFLVNVGLDYLTLDRAAGTLSGGEAQRIRLATQIGSELVGVLYILDEPSIGLHQRDNRRLLDALKRLRDLGNTVIVVEHDEETISEADYVVDIGPGAGEHGGEVVAAGHARGGAAANPDSLTGAVPVGARLDPRAPSAPAPGRDGEAARRGAGRPGEQPEEHRRGVPAGAVHLRHRGVRLGQEHPGQRDALQARWPRSCTGRRERGGGARRRSTGWSTWTR